jgi:hypothetical protein
MLPAIQEQPAALCFAHRPTHRSLFGHAMKNLYAFSLERFDFVCRGFLRHRADDGPFRFVDGSAILSAKKISK